MKTELQKFMAELVQECEGKSYLFRGTTLQYSEEGAEGATEINSSLYRWAVGENFVFYEKYRPFNMEKEIVGSAKKHFPDNTSNIEVLTDLQHYGGKTNLIDFSRNLYKALYFACDRDFEEDGELICLKNSITIKKDVDYEDMENTLSPFIIEPAGTQTSQRRVIAQDSVFIYAPKGFLEQKFLKQEDLEIIPVPSGLKKDILDHLKEFHNIDTNTIYNDLMGFITNEKNYETAAIHFYKGLMLATKGNHEEAIENYNEAIKLNPDLEAAYFNRGNSKAALEQHQDAIKDFDEAIELNPKYVWAYNNRGMSKHGLGKHEEAIKDLETAKGLFKWEKNTPIFKALEKHIQDCKDKLNKR